MLADMCTYFLVLRLLIFQRKRKKIICIVRYINFFPHFFKLQSFWMENQTRNDKSKDIIPLDGNSVPLYDRGYALGLTSADGSSNVDGYALLLCIFLGMNLWVHLAYQF